MTLITFLVDFRPSRVQSSPGPRPQESTATTQPRPATTNPTVTTATPDPVTPAPATSSAQNPAIQLRDLQTILSTMNSK